MHHPTDRITHTTAFVTAVVEHWLEREIAQWVHPMKDRSDNPLHHERTLYLWATSRTPFKMILVGNRNTLAIINLLTAIGLMVSMYNNIQWCANIYNLIRLLHPNCVFDLNHCYWPHLFIYFFIFNCATIVIKICFRLSWEFASARCRNVYMAFILL